MVFVAGRTAHVYAATDDEVTRVFAHLPDPLLARQRFPGERCMETLPVSAPVAGESARRAAAHGALPEALALGVFLLLPDLLCDLVTGVVSEGKARPHGRLSGLFDRVVDMKVLGVDIIADGRDELFCGGCLDPSVRSVITFLCGAEG